MILHLRRAVIVSVILFALTGLAYPYAVTGISHLLFRHQADGSLSSNGSTLIGQAWTGPMWFQGRPSATLNADGKSQPYNPMASGASNLGPRAKALQQAAAANRAALVQEGITPTAGLVTASGSGLDPDISPADAYAQVAAVARARGLPISVVHHLVATHIHSPELGFLGAQYVNVLDLNEALARLASSG
jgi:K+-transporting ATPase ATPase C chain